MRKILSICTLMAAVLMAEAQSPSPTYNSVVTYQPRVASTQAADLLQDGKANISVHYFDGFQSPLQTVHFKASPSQKDLVSGYHTTDALGRAQRTYLPVPTGIALGAYQPGVHSMATGFYGDAYPYSEVLQYQPSPLSVPVETIGPGQAFRAGLKSSNQGYQTAGAGIRKYLYRNNTEVDTDGFFNDGDLIKTYQTDEDGNRITTYSDGVSGLLYESHQKDKNTNNTLVTTYIYDELGRQKYILPPKATAAALNNVGNSELFDQNEPLFLEGIYGFNYNQWGLVSQTHKPGGGWTYTVYNELEQPVMSQDARLRLNNLWVWTKKDGLGRTIMSGTVYKNDNLTAVQSEFFNNGAAQQFEERSTASGNMFGYTNGSFPQNISLSPSDVQAVYYYDDYNWVANSSLNFSFYKTAQYGNAKSLPTGSMVRRLDTGAFLKSVSYYDDQNRVIQTKTENRFGGINQTDVVYDFAGQVLEQRILYAKPGQAVLELKTSYQYDHQGRQIGAVHALNGKVTPLAQYVYDEIGRLKQKNLMAAAEDIITENSPQPNGDQDLANRYVLLEPGTITAENGSYLACVLPAALQKIDYSYDIRGRLRGINTDASGNIQLQDGDVLAIKLDHHETNSTFNGKIAKQTWQSAASASTPRWYAYTYDGYDRLNGASYSGQGSENYSLSSLAYDANGNINTLNRNGWTGQGWGNIDNLNFSYSQPTFGNQLDGVIDYGNSNVGQKDNGSSNDYTYWPDGSLKSDANKAISLIDYNFLGLPEKIHFGSSIRIENIYDAEGLLLYRKFVNGASSLQTDYMGGLIYQDGLLQSIAHDEGRIKVEAGNLNSLHYQFFISDHLGNTRAIVERIDASTALVQETHYYPFGAVMENMGLNGDWKFLYQGKENITFNGANLYDFHTRAYDAYLGRFMQLDGANQFASGYVGMGNSPVNGVDPDGQFWNFVVGAALGGVSGYQIGKSQGAKGWEMAGYIFSGAAIGTITAGVGSTVLGSFSTAATSGINLGQSMLAYGVSGAASGAFGGGAFAGLAGQNVGLGALSGLLWGGAAGAAAGGLQFLSTERYVNNRPRLAQNGDPIYSGGLLNEITVTAKRNVLLDSFGKRESVSGVLGNLSYLWSGGIENGAIYDRDGYPYMYAPQMGAPDLIGGIAGRGGLAAARALGIAGEEAVGVGSKVRIESLTGTAKYRIPDILTPTTLGEVKNVSNLSLTRQLTDFHLFSQQTGRQFILYTRPNTTFSGPLQNLINNGSIITKPIPFR